ncbi:MAG: hypothetical protein QOH16_3507 [Gaiellaceae bacterium]|nr:hypothetical protein [Gaiellaceae bacterium]
MPRTPKAPPGELDLLLKLSMRRIFWGMNYATRLNLKLALPTGQRTEELSDLDCVGFSTGADFSVRILIADCKSGQKVSAATRAFWLAGARDFVGADRAYLVLQRSIPPGVRELGGSLALDILGDADRQILENVHGQYAPAVGPFDVSGVARLNGLLTQVDKKLESLNRFREHDYWHLPPERRLQRLIVELRAAGPALKTEQLAHRVLVLDLLFLFALSILGACRYVSAVSLHDPKNALLEYLLGGPAATRERRQQLKALKAGVAALEKAASAPPRLLDAFELEPSYFAALAETVARFVRRPRDAQRVLRYVEWWAQAQEGLGLPSAPEKLGATYGQFTQKLVSDMARTCFSAAGLGSDWMAIANRAGADIVEDTVSIEGGAKPSVSGHEVAEDEHEAGVDSRAGEEAGQLPIDGA